LFIGFGFPYEGPAPLEAIANGCVFLQARFNPPHSSLNHEFFRGKPTSREATGTSVFQVSSQHPYAEDFIGKPHVWTVDYNNSEEFEAAIKTIMRTQVDPYLPYEYTCEGMLERIHAYIQHQVWPPVASLQVWVSEPQHTCTDTCRRHGLVCEPTFFRFLNKEEVFLQ
ncbi:MGT5B acetylglucosaminyltransferase, partial [Quiscalus mexicanus]|nr:MGT5B acetylglucosaminyltransferase [Quiscalus mexicanus]